MNIGVTLYRELCENLFGLPSPLLIVCMNTERIDEKRSYSTINVILESFRIPLTF